MDLSNLLSVIFLTLSIMAATSGSVELSDRAQALTDPDTETFAKRVFRYGKREPFRYGKRSPSVFRYGKRAEYDTADDEDYDGYFNEAKRVFRYGKRSPVEVLPVAFELPLHKRVFRYGKREEDDKRKVFQFGKRPSTEEEAYDPRAIRQEPLPFRLGDE